MKAKNEIKKKLLKLRANLLSAVAELDPRGTDQRITETMCVIETTVDAAIFGEKISASKAAKLGLVLSKSA